MIQQVKLEKHKRLILTIGVISLLVFYFLYINDFHFAYVITVVWLVLIIPIILLGNKMISRILQKHFPWSEYLSQRFFIQLLSMMIYSLICFNLSYLIFKLVFTNDPPSPNQIALVNIYGSILVVPAFSIYYVVHFINEWKKSQIRSEKLEKESIQSQYNNLKNHLDPHFLFNNLNILSSLIDKDVKSSKQYLSRFAEVYRFMLQNKSSELITLRQEMEFSNAYFHLISIRFSDALVLYQKISPHSMEKYIPPFTIQMLIENAVKHNAFSRSKPMTIEIIENTDYLMIRNQICKPQIGINSHGSGLKNIKARYKYFTDNEMEITNNGDNFIVKIPLIELDEE